LDLLDFLIRSAGGFFEAGDKKKLWLKALLNVIFIVQAVRLDRNRRFPSHLALRPGTQCTTFGDLILQILRYDVQQR
jgi:hypothetical protein